MFIAKTTASAILLTLLLTSMLTLAFIIQPVRAEPRTWIVDDYGAGDFNTIQQAIDAASSGDIIFVCNGTYYEHLTIGKSLSLIGENKLYTTIDGNSTGDVVSITSDDTRIVNFTIQYGYSGISLLHCRNNSISSNILLNNNRGVAVNCSDDNLFFHNDFVNNAQQVYDYSWEKIDYPPSINIWDDGYPSGGNYWSNYIGNDTYSGPFQDVVCSDGLGDMPFEIDQNNEDSYPLMLPWDDPYNHQAAYMYAFEYYNRVCSDEYYWYYSTYPPLWWSPSSPLPSEPHYDCAHFVSCAIGSEPHEMGGGLIVPDDFPGHATYGIVGVQNLKNWLLSSGLGVQKSSVYDLIKGDVIFYSWPGYPMGGAGTLGLGQRHSALYVGYLGISSHDYSRFGEAWDSPVGFDTAYFVHIKGPLPQVSTLPATGISGTSATLNGNLDSNGGEDCEVWFVWDTASHSSYQSYAHSTPHQTMYAWQTGSFQEMLSSVTPGTRHYFRAVAKNYEGTVQGAELFFDGPPPPAFDFSISASPSSQTVTAGGSTSYGVTVTLTSGSTQSVSLSCSGLPSGATASFSPSSGNPTFSSTMTVQTSSGTPAGTYTLTITGNGGGKTHSTTVQLIVNAPPPKYTLTVQVDGSGTTSPAPGSYQYDQGSVVPVTALPSSGYKLDRWQLDGSNVGNANPYSVTMNSNHTLKAFFVVTPLTVHISPLSASIHPGQSVTFTSTVSGGQPPYGYQWYLDGAPVSGATTSTWVFTPTTSGIYYVYLKVTDDNNNVAQSETARITVSTVPVGGYSFPIQVQTKTEPIIPYIALIAALTAIFTKLRPKTKRKH